MRRYVLRRLGQGAFTLWVISLLVFLFVRMTGDPTAILLPPEATEEDVSALRRELGYDRPLVEQYFTFLGDILRGDFGSSVRFQRPALDVVLEHYPTTLYLGGVAILFSILIAIPIGIYAAVYRGRTFDYVARTFAAFAQALPPFWLGLIFILIFAVWLGWLPTSGNASLQHVILPAITQALFSIASLLRMTRSSMLDVLDAEYIKLARVKGMGETRIIWQQAFRNAALPVLTLAALLVVHVLNGIIIVEAVFAWPGVGTLTVEAVQFRDYPVVQTVTLIMAAMFVLANLLVDIAYAYLNPKVRYA